MCIIYYQIDLYTVCIYSGIILLLSLPIFSAVSAKLFIHSSPAATPSSSDPANRHGAVYNFQIKILIALKKKQPLK